VLHLIPPPPPPLVRERERESDLARIGTDAQRAAQGVRGEAANAAVFAGAVDFRTGPLARRRRRRPLLSSCPWRQWRAGRSTMSGGTQNADAVTDRLRQEAVLIAETSAEHESLAGARRAVEEPGRLVVRFTAESVVGVQSTVLERQLRGHRRQISPRLSYGCYQHAVIAMCHQAAMISRYKPLVTVPLHSAHLQCTKTRRPEPYFYPKFVSQQLQITPDKTQFK